MILKIRFNAAEIIYWSKRYYFPSEDTAEKISKRIRGSEYLLQDDFLALCKWKSPRITNHCMKNSPDLIKEISRVAFQTKSEQLRIEILTLLKGVNWPTASALLHFGHIEPYPIIDFRALWSLGVENPPHSYAFDLWWEYTIYCREISELARVSMRTLDKALWQYSKENQEKYLQEEFKKKINIGSSQLSGENKIKLPYGGMNSSFRVGDLLSYMESMDRDYIIQGGINCSYEDHPKPHSLDYWLRSFYSKNKDTKQAVKLVIDDLLKTGLFTLEEKLLCPDSGKLCKGILLKK